MVCCTFSPWFSVIVAALAKDMQRDPWRYYGQLCEYDGTRSFKTGELTQPVMMDNH